MSPIIRPGGVDRLFPEDYDYAEFADVILREVSSSSSSSGSISSSSSVSVSSSCSSWSSSSSSYSGDSSSSSSSTSYQSTTPQTGNVYSSDPHLILAHLFEVNVGNVLYDTTENNHDLIKSDTMECSLDRAKQGNRSLKVPAGGIAGMDTTVIKSVFPFRNGRADPITICFWWYKYTVPTPPGEEYSILCQHIAIDGSNRCFQIVVNSDGDMWFQVGTDGGTVWRSIEAINSFPATAGWFHIQVSYESNDVGANCPYRIRVWSDSLGRYYKDQQANFTYSLDQGGNNSRFWLGSNINYNPMYGYLDEFLIFRRYLSDDELDDIREGTFSYSSSSSASESSSSSSVSAGATWDYEQSFDALNLGDLDGQDAWLETTNALAFPYVNIRVGDNYTYAGSTQSVYLALNRAEQLGSIERNLPQYRNGVVYAAIRLSTFSRIWALPRIAYSFTSSAGGTNEYIYFYFDTSRNLIASRDLVVNDPIEVLATDAQNYVWYVVGLSFDMGATYGERFQVRLNNGDWSSLTHSTYNYTDLYATQMSLRAGSNAAGGYTFWIDEISITNPFVPSVSSSSSSSKSSSSSSASESCSSSSLSSSSKSSSSSASQRKIRWEVYVELQDSYGVTQEYVHQEVSALSWTYSRIGGCSDVNVTLSGRSADDYGDVDASWRILVYARLGKRRMHLVYQGYVTDIDASLTDRETVTIRGRGFSSQLEWVVVQEDYSSEQEIKLTLQDIMQGKVADQTDITCIKSYIKETGYSPDYLRFKNTALEAVRRLGELAGNWEWGVDRNRNFYFLPPSQETRHQFIVGDKLTKFSPVSTSQEIRNKLLVENLPGSLLTLINEYDLSYNGAPGDTPTSRFTYTLGTGDTYKIMQPFVALKSTMARVTLESRGLAGFTQLLTNGSFAASNPLEGWTKVFLSDLVEPSVNSPDRSCLFVFPTGNKGGIYQRVTLSRGWFTLRWNSNIVRGSYRAVVRDADDMYDELATSETYSATRDEEGATVPEWRDPQRLHSLYFEIEDESQTVDVCFLKVGSAFQDTRYYIDDVMLFENAPRLALSLVDAASPGTTITNALETVIFDDKTWDPDRDRDYQPALVNLNLSYPLTSGHTYAIILETLGAYDNRNYFLLSYTNVPTGEPLSCYSVDSQQWTESTDGLYYQIQYSESQELYGIREELASHSSFSSQRDAQQWANAYLAAKDHPQKRVSIQVSNYEDILEFHVPGHTSLGCVAIRGGGYETGGYEKYDIQTVQYRLTDGGFDVTINAGSVLPDISNYLARIQYEIETIKELSS